MIPDTFNLANITDTCALWHIVGADTLFRTARRANVAFIITSTVHYECFIKTRGTSPTAERQAMQQTLRGHLDAKQVTKVALTIADLQDTLDFASRNGLDKRLGQGELSCAALARSLGHPAVLTDNRTDFKAIEQLVDGRLQKTPLLLGWLYFEGHLSDADVAAVVQEHQASLGQMVGVYKKAYGMACEKRLMRQTLPPSSPRGGCT